MQKSNVRKSKHDTHDLNYYINTPVYQDFIYFLSYNF